MTADPASKKPADPRIGMVLSERYRIIRKLGDGGMGAVYEGEHLMIKRRVAIKVLHPQFAQHPEIVARFQREAQAATAIGHPNIVEVTDMGRFEDGTSYMVLEFLQGRDWSHDIKEQGAQPLGKCVHILDQVCDALEAAHGKGIVHRDLKPENVFLIERRGDLEFVKVLDFGISKIADEQEGDRSLTQTGTALGTPYYMAPEQCQGKKDIDLRADIYSLGVMLFQGLTGQYPFDDESYPMLVLKICTQQPPSLTQYRPDVPVEVEHIVNRMLAKDRAHRFASCADVRAALAPFASQNDAPVLAEDAPSTAGQGPSVLAGQGGAGPAYTPNGTAYLNNPPAPPSGTPYPAGETSASSVPLIATVAGALTFLVLAGVGVGAYFAVAGNDSAEGSAAAAPPSDPADDVVDEETSDEAEGATESATVQPELIPVRVVVEPEEADAEIVIDDIARNGTSGYEGALTPGAHELVVTAEGYQRYERTVEFRAGDPPWRVPLSAEEEDRPPSGGGSHHGGGGSHGGGSAHHHQQQVVGDPQPLQTGGSQTHQQSGTSGSGSADRPTANPFDREGSSSGERVGWGDIAGGR